MASGDTKTGSSECLMNVCSAALDGLQGAEATWVEDLSLQIRPRGCTQQPELMLLMAVATHHFSRWLAHPHNAFRSVSQHRLFEMTHTLRLNL